MCRWVLKIVKIQRGGPGIKRKTAHERMNDKAPLVGGIFECCVQLNIKECLILPRHRHAGQIHEFVSCS
jgi:hypothetical protein